MAHPYSKHAQDKAGRAKAAAYQSGGKVSEPASLGGRELDRRDNYATGAAKLKEGIFGLPMRPGSFLHRMKNTTSALNSYEVSREVPRRKED